jgi:hypothetical protein
MRRWLVTYRLLGTGADRIEVEATGPVAALDAAKRLLPDSAKLVGYRVDRGGTTTRDVPVASATSHYAEGCLGSAVLAIKQDVAWSMITACERALNTPHLWASNFPQF